MLDILQYSESALSYVDNVPYEEFVEDARTRYAILHCLTVIGEAAGRVRNTSAAEVAQLPWQRMKNLRNFIVHDYEGVNIGEIWRIVTIELPVVVKLLAPLFPERPIP